jgi:N-acyl-D-amino-acid deacylase
MTLPQVSYLLCRRSSTKIVRAEENGATWAPLMLDIIIAGGKIVDGSCQPWYRADVGSEGDRIAAIGQLGHAEARQRIDATGKIVAPGFIDAHVHGDLALLTDPYHEPAIRQGVTTYLLGQDGVAMAPASPATLAYMRQYTAGFSGIHAVEGNWSTIAEYLERFEHRCALNVAMLIPNGNVRMEALGLATRTPTQDELKKMRRLVREGMEQGAVGLSTGLDYIPSRYAETEELIALCEEIAPFSGIYVTHMRRYDPVGLDGSMEEVFRIGREADVGVHISHFNSRADLALAKLDEGRKHGIDCTYDLYCYLAGSTILGMIALPPWVQEGGVDATVERLRDPAVRQRLQEAFDHPRGPLDRVKLSFVAAPELRHLEGQTLGQAANEAGQPLSAFVCDLLVASRMLVGCIAPHLARDEDDVRGLMRHPAMMAGSDGIFVGGRPHPRGCGCFARYLGHYVREARTWSLEEAVSKLSAHAARRFGLKDRGLLREKMAADVVVFDSAAIADRSTFENGKQLAEGMEHVIVNGKLVLHAGKRTTALPGRGLRRQ